MFKFIFIFHFVFNSEKNYEVGVIELLFGSSMRVNEFFKASCPKYIRHNEANFYEWTKRCNHPSGIHHPIHRLPFQDIESNRVSPSGSSATEYLTILNKKVKKEWVLALFAFLILK